MDTLAKAIGIDFGGTGVKLAVTQGGKIIARGETIDTRQHTAEGALFEAILAGVATLRESHPDVQAVGMGLPGFVDSVKGVSNNLANVRGWNGVPVLQILRDRTELAAAVENDANAMAYGEFIYGAAKGTHDVICITLGTGVGGALVLDGKLYRGARFAAGELGHSSIDYRGPVGVYNTPGDLERYVGNDAITRRTSELFESQGQPRPIEQCTPADLAKAANEGDAEAKALWDCIGTEIGAALVNAIWLVNPDAIVIGGGVAKAGELVMAPIRKTIIERTSEFFHEKLRIVPAALGNDAGIFGAAHLALESKTQ